MRYVGNYLRSVREIVLSPEEFFSQEFEPGFSEPIKFAATSGGMVGTLGTTVLLGLSIIPQNPILILAGLLGGIFLGAFGSLMNTVSIHPLIYLLGGTGFVKSYKALAYSTASNALFIWIPGINLLGLVYNFYLQAKALSMMHEEISLGKAMVAEAVPALLLTVVGIAVGYLAVLSGFVPIPV